MVLVSASLAIGSRGMAAVEKVPRHCSHGTFRWPSMLRSLLTDLLTNASRRAGMRRDAMGPKLGIVPGQAGFRGTAWDTLVRTSVGLGPGARKGVQVRILSRAPRLTGRLLPLTGYPQARRGPGSAGC